MTDPMVDALRRIVEANGGATAVADKIEVNDQTIYQILKGVRLPSGRPKGVGPALRAKLDEHYPGWRLPTHTAQAPQQVGDFGQVAAAGAGQAHPLKLYEFTVPPLIEWGELMKTKVLPPAFRLVANDDALAPKILRGTGLIMAAGHSAQPGQVILVQRGNGERHLRRYAVGADQAWRARAPNEDFPTYDSADDPDLTMLAVLRWIDAEGY